jgi:hypothetical protein
VVELTKAVDSIALENTQLKARLSSTSVSIIVFDMDETIVTICKKQTTLTTYPISYLNGDIEVKESIVIRPFVLYVLQKVSIMITNWSILFMFYLIYS